jgi:hypothetical protein
MNKLNQVIIEGEAEASNFRMVAKNYAAFELAYTQHIYDRTEIHSIECVALEGVLAAFLEALFSKKEQLEVRVIGHLEQTYATGKACRIICEHVEEIQ